MKIIQLSAERFKAIEAIEIKPDGKPIVLTGDNAQGKSSILDSIFSAITGKLPAEPIKRGSDKAKITLDLGEFIIERRITDKGSYLEVRDADGNKVSSPQKVLNELLGKLTFDPLEFTRMKPKDQRESLMDVAGLKLDDLDQAYKKAYDDRTLAGRELTKAKAHLDSLPRPETEVFKPVDVAQLMERRKRIVAARDASRESVVMMENLKDSITSAGERVAAKLKEIQRLEKEIEEIEAQRVKNEQTLKEIAAKQGNHDYTEDLAKVDSEIEAAHESQEAIRQQQSVDAATLEYQEKLAEHTELDTKCAKILEDKATRIKNADFGIPGLAIDDEGVTYKEIPFTQMSTAQQVEVSTMMAMRQNPKLKIILIREGALIGSKIWDSIVKLATKHDYQLWVEKFQEQAGASGLHIKEGRIVAVDGHEVAPTEMEETEEIDL
jgi:DNA repair exonuclease SbcCD ATPase subunit